MTRCPSSRSGTPSPVSDGRHASAAAMASKAWARARTSKNVPSVAGIGAPCALRSSRVTSRSACGKGSGSTRIGLTTLNTAVLAPMPTASVATAVHVNAGLRRRRRSA
ncbi:MAG TPA: hypothetical protein VG916_07225 [Gemmatimonadaceae bacterium]|nr:hypothetical protein [Gemmatimonadaceae bacterium]